MESVSGSGEVTQRKTDTVLTFIDGDIPERLFLDQNYPNPFRVSTTIRYGIPRNGFVSVGVYTMFGVPVKTLLSENQKAGIYTLDLIEPDLLPGLYFYKLQTDYGTITRRLTVSK